MLIAHKIALDPNNEQATYFKKACGAARFAYNWALAEWKRQYQAHKANPSLPRPSQMALRRQLNAIKRERFPWMLEVTKCAPQMAIIQLGEAFKNFFAGRARYPQFRKKGVQDRFTLTNDQFSVDGCRIHIPNLGLVRMRESLRFAGKIMSATVSRVADRWFVSITVDTKDDSHLPKAENEPQDESQVTGEFQCSQNRGVVGVDLGVSALATLSTGEKIAGPKPHTTHLKRLRRLSRRLSRKQKGSRNRAKARDQLARLHARLTNLRQDALHKLTTDLTRRFHTITIEDLNVRGMLKNRHLSRSIADAGFFEFRRQLEYKSVMRGGQVVVADRFYASSKKCSACGHILDALPLSVRTWRCPVCGTVHDRDVNGARNLFVYGLAALNSPTASSAGSYACEEEGSGSGLTARVKPASIKQEVSFVPV